MIDTDKYEGHTEGLWFDGEPTKISNTISNAFFQLYPNDIGKANARLAIDAPLLLAEVKRLTALFEETNHHLDLMVERFGIEALVEMVGDEQE